MQAEDGIIYQDWCYPSHHCLNSQPPPTPVEEEDVIDVSVLFVNDGEIYQRSSSRRNRNVCLVGKRIGWLVYL